ALAALLLCAAPLTRAADETLLRAKAMLDASNAKAAYELLAPLQSQRAGDPQYDYLLGVAALNLGRNTEAVFALERVLAVQPSNAPARAQIARAYFNLKETETAKREFETVRGQGVPEDVRGTIDRYLDAIDRIADVEGMSAGFFLEFSAGYDSNINGATAVNEVAIPAFGNLAFRLDPLSVETPDWFFSAAGGIALSNPLGKALALVGGISAYKRVNFEEDLFDTGYLDGYLGLTHKLRRDTFTLVGQANAFLVDDPIYRHAYREAFGGTAQWTRDFDARNQLTAYLQYAALLYPEQAPRDADRYIAGAGYAHAFRGGDATAYAGLYGGTEQARDDAFEYLGYDLAGLRLGGQKGLTERTYLFGSASVELRRAHATDPFFQVDREDEQYTASLGLHYLLPRAWRLSPQVTYLYNNSNIELNEYDRWQGFVTLRRDW
ncbi:MAG TPA: tetratricopeptide repeat protein, partial [Burkholderiales bacterium]|nr:tetratricopeptide repeat protein [Burkholderiales bacterium]